MERDIQKDAVRAFNMMPGVRAFRNNSGSAKRGKCYVEYGLRAERGERGGPDIVLCADGLFIGVELKDLGEKPKPHQYAWGEALESAGNGIWVWGDNLQMLMDRVGEIMRTRKSA